MSITIRIRSWDGHNDGTLSLSPDAREVQINPSNKHGEQSLRNLLRTKPADRTPAAWLHDLVHIMRGRAWFEQDDWTAEPHGHTHLEMYENGDLVAILTLENGRLRIQPTAHKTEEKINHLFNQIRSPHWSDTDLFHALPEFATGDKLRVVPVQETNGTTQQYAAVGGRETLGSLGAAARVAAGGPVKGDTLRPPVTPPTPMQATRRAVASLLAHHESQPNVHYPQHLDTAHLNMAEDALKESGMPAGQLRDYLAYSEALRRIPREASGGVPFRGHTTLHGNWKDMMRIALAHGARLAGIADPQVAYHEAQRRFDELLRHSTREPIRLEDVQNFYNFAQEHGFLPQDDEKFSELLNRMRNGEEIYNGDLADAWYFQDHADHRHGHWPESARRFLQATEPHGYGKDGEPERYAEPLPEPRMPLHHHARHTIA